MPMDRIEIGGTPYNEPCAQIGVYDEAQAHNRLECQAYIAAMTAVYGTPPAGARFTIRSNAHDFGTYYEVAILYDTGIQAAVDYALKVENGLGTWEEAGFWPPVTYADKGGKTRPVHVIDDPKAWSRTANPQAHARLVPQPPADCAEAVLSDLLSD